MAKIRFKHNIEGNVTTTVITHKGRQFEGKAVCHEDDLQFQNQYTGINISRSRAEVKYNQYRLDKALDEMKALIPHRRYPGVSTRLLVLEAEIGFRKSLINDIVVELAKYIKDKEYFYSKIRAKQTKVEEEVQ